MLHHFFTELRAARIPVTTREYLTLLEALDKGVVNRRSGISTRSAAPRW